VQRYTIIIAVFVATCAVTAWQWHEYEHECEQAREIVAGSADSIMNALVGGVQSHRRLGPFFEESMQAVLDGLVRSRDVLAVALISTDGNEAFSAGNMDLLPLRLSAKPGQYWDPAGFRQVAQVVLPAEPVGPGRDFGRGYGGRGWGRRGENDEAETASSFKPGDSATAVLIVDRARADYSIARARWSRGLIVAVSWAFIVCVAVTWQATVRLTEARGRAVMFEAQSRHWQDLSQAAAGLAHETRNPLGLIRGWTQRLAEECPGGPEVQQKSQAVIEECDRLTARINQFLAFARPSDPQRQRFDPVEVVKELSVLLEPDLALHDLTLQPPAPGLTLSADRELFRQALFNLLLNALQASPDHGIVEVKIEQDRGGRLRLDVADRGPGVNRELIDRLFSPYFTTREGGNGLGLAIVRRIAVAHGWDVTYLPRPGGGAIFRMTGMHA
jgi:signal transduction histidine kinase